MSGAAARVGVGTRFRCEGEIVEVVEMAATTAGNEVVLSDGQGRVLRLALRELLFSDRAQVIPDQPGPSAGDVEQIASVVLGQLRADEREMVLERAAHIREVLTGYCSGSSASARAGEPRPQFMPGTPAELRYLSKAEELGVSIRTVKQWVSDFRQHGEAGLAPKRKRTDARAARSLSPCIPWTSPRTGRRPGPERRDRAWPG